MKDLETVLVLVAKTLARQNGEHFFGGQPWGLGLHLHYGGRKLGENI
jgi:hypothetical protein